MRNRFCRLCLRRFGHCYNDHPQKLTAKANGGAQKGGAQKGGAQNGGAQQGSAQQGANRQKSRDKKTGV